MLHSAPFVVPFSPYWCLLVGVHVEHCLFVPRNPLKILILLMFQLKRHLSLTQVSLHLHLFISYRLQVVASQVPNLFDSKCCGAHRLRATDRIYKSRGLAAYGAILGSYGMVVQHLNPAVF
jgi:hypothetical protein